MRYIYADKLIDDIRHFAEYDSNRRNKDWVRRFEIAIDAQPTADVRENVRGEWITDELTGWLCSNCGEHIVLNIRMHGNFCPNCGANMMRES